MIKDKDSPESEPIEDLKEPLNTKKEGEQERVEPVKKPTYDGDFERFKGKEFDDIVKSYQELEKEYGKKGNEYGQIKQERDALKQYYESQLLQQQQSQQTPSVSADSFWEKPDVAVGQVVDQKLRQFEATMRKQQAMTAAGMAKFQAKAQWPEAFDGIEDSQLDQLIYGGIQAGSIAPEFAANPQGWAMSAWQLKGQQMGFKVPQGNPKPPKPPQSDAPPSVKSYDSQPAKLTSDAEALVDAWFGNKADDKTKKEIAESNLMEARKRRGEE